MARLFRDKIIEGLAIKGFRPVAYIDLAPRVLTVDVREISYSTDMDFWKGTIQAKAILRAFCLRDGVPFDQSYLGERKDTTLEAPGAATNEKLINGAISDVVQKLLDDEHLLYFLAN